MFQNLPVFRLSMAMAQHAAAQQAIVATNIANADTPGFKARRSVDFAEAVTRGFPTWGGVDWPGRPEFPGHQQAGPATSPNGNDVSLEEEMLHSVDATRAHNRALAIYRSHLNILHAAISRT